MKKINLSLIVLIICAFFVSSCGMIGSCSSCGTTEKSIDKKTCDGGCDKAAETCGGAKDESKKSCGCGK